MSLNNRRSAIIIGGSLVIMAVLAGISIPAVGVMYSTIGLIGVFLLDIIVSFGVFRYYKGGKPKLALTTTLLRLIYTAFLGVGIGYLFAGDVSMFNEIWGWGLITFGLHLVCLGLLIDIKEDRKWVGIVLKILLILAGIGYLVQYIGILVVADPSGYATMVESIFIAPMILGEIFFALWMLIRGGRR
jgi:hypothetical protein